MLYLPHPADNLSGRTLEYSRCWDKRPREKTGSKSAIANRGFYAIYALASTYPAGIFTGPLGAWPGRHQWRLGAQPPLAALPLVFAPRFGEPMSCFVSLLVKAHDARALLHSGKTFHEEATTASASAPSMPWWGRAQRTWGCLLLGASDRGG